MEEHDPASARLHDATISVYEASHAIRALAESMQKNTNSQTIHHEYKGMGAWGAAAVTACLMTFLGLILLAVVVVPELHDLRAWQDIMRAKIAKLEASK